MIAPSMPLASFPLSPPHLPLAAVLALGSIILGRTVLLLWSRLTSGSFDAALVELASKPRVAPVVPHYTAALVDAIDLEVVAEDKPEIPPRPKRTQRPADVYLTEDEIMAILYTSATFRGPTSVLGYAPDPLLPPLLEVDEE